MSNNVPDGHMPKPTSNAVRDSSFVMQRRILRDAVPRNFALQTIAGKAPAASQSRLWYGTDDYRTRRDYVCGGTTPQAGVGLSQYSGMLRAAQQNCDGSGVEGTSCNPRNVPDASDFARYRAISSTIPTYNQ